MRSILLYWNKKLNRLTNDTIIRILVYLTVVFCLGFCYSCDPLSRYNRLVDRYPYLVNRTVFDTIYIRNGKTLDTTFIWNQGKDTVYFGTTRIERHRDTFRFYYREQNCTTNVNKTEIRPSKETKIVTEGKGLKTFDYVLVGICLILLLIVLWKR